MKRVFAAVLAVVMLLGLCGCGETKEASGIVSVTIPGTFFGETPAEDIQAGAEKKGYVGCTVAEDGTVTYRMNVQQYQEECAQLRDQLQESVELLTKGKDAVASFREIRCAEDFSAFDVYVDMEKYTMLDSFFGMGFMATGAYYQIFAGADPDKVDVVVSFIDEATGDVVDTASYRELR